MKYQLIVAVIALNFAGVCPRAYTAERPNVIFIICDDLNDYVEGFDGHPDAVTPHMARLAKSGVRFTQTHCNIPICGPSRANLFTGIYPHHSGCYGFTKWETDEVLKNSLWQESTQVPLIVRAPNVARRDVACDTPVSLIDLYPTFVDLCGLTGETKKNDKGHTIHRPARRHGKTSTSPT